MATQSECDIIQNITTNELSKKDINERIRFVSNNKTDITDDNCFNDNHHHQMTTGIKLTTPIAMATKTSNNIHDECFEEVFNKSMDDLENDAIDSGDESDIDGDFESDTDSHELKEIINRENRFTRTKRKIEALSSVKNTKLNTYQNFHDSDDDDDDGEDDDEDSPGKIFDAINNSSQYLPLVDAKKDKMLFFRPYLLPFQERRRLSQCKEEDENEDSDCKHSPPSQQNGHSPLALLKKEEIDESKQKQDSFPLLSFIQPEQPLQQSTSLALHSFGQKSAMEITTTIKPGEEMKITENFLDSNGKREQSHADKWQEPVTKLHKPLVNSPLLDSTITTKVIRGKFTIITTKTTPESAESLNSTIVPNEISNGSKQLRSEAEELKNMTAKQNSATIHFPCSSGVSKGYASLRGLFSPEGTKTPHLDRRFFDTSLVEIRSVSTSTKSLDKCDTIVRDDDVWIPRKKTPSQLSQSSQIPVQKKDDEQDGNKLVVPGAPRPSSAPSEPNAKAARKASKKMEKEARRQEKELRRTEKEARKIEKETARRLEREAAKLEKLNRNHEKISRSTERVGGPRSGSLERRRSGDETPVLNQSTVHGIASPNRRPTIFDVFRPRTKSDAKRKDKDVAKLSGSDRDNSSASSNHSGSGGLMQTMKTGMQNMGLIGHRHSTDKPKYKDGSAHPHAGSDAQYYHTVTAVRRADVSRSPMTKVMDLFRHRSNSAVSEADKRKARAAAHQQQLAAQSKYTRFFPFTLIT